MVTRRDIQDFADRIAEKFRPAKIVLFGSYAYGTPTEDSDVDVLVVIPHRGSPARKATEIRLACPREFPLDLMVRSSREFHERVRMGDFFMQEIAERGVILHEQQHS